MRPHSRFSLVSFVASAAALFACAPTPPPPGPPIPMAVSAAPAPAASASVAPATDVVLPPGAVRCGVDDEPVPLGDLLPPRRPLTGVDRSLLAEPPIQLPPQARARPMEVTLKARSEDVGATDVALSALFGDCEPRATLGDTGSLAVRVSFTASGAPRVSTPVSTPGVAAASPYARCLVERACRLPVVPALAGKSGTVEVRTTVVPPVFRGKVEAQVVFGQPPAGMGPPRVTKAQRAKLDSIRSPVEAASLRCARALPPTDDIVFSFSAVMTPNQKPDLLRVPLGGHAETVLACVMADLPAILPKMPQETLVTISVQIHAGETGP